MFNLLMYVLCSSLLLVINKVTVHLIPMPGFVLFSQMLASVGYVKVMESSLGVQVDRFEKSKVSPPRTSPSLLCSFMPHTQAGSPAASPCLLHLLR